MARTLFPGPRAGFGGNNAGGLILWWVEPPALTWEILRLQQPKVEVRGPEATDEASARESPHPRESRLARVLSTMAKKQVWGGGCGAEGIPWRGRNDSGGADL